MWNTLIFIVMVLIGTAQEPVLKELARQQQEIGLTLASFHRKLETINFSTRSLNEKKLPVASGHPNEGAVSRDGEYIAFDLSVDQPYQRYLGIVHSDGNGLREYRNVMSPSSICWSYDKSQLALSAAHRRQLHGELLVLGLEANVTQELEAGGYVTSQCWSPDDKRVVYGVGNSIRIYDLGERKSRELAKGEEPTWSPDGNWIAYHDKDAYYEIRPSGTEQKQLFRQKGIRTGLWWSPDGSMVAYMCVGGKYDPHRDFDFVPRQLRVRRLADNADESILEGPDVAYVPSYQWVLPEKAKAH
jgi:Tol biopolymer transport system component